MQDASPLRIRLFGPMEVEVGGQPMPKVRSKKGLWTLALLVLRQGRPVPRSWVAGTLWPDSLEEQALANLRLTLTDLRHALGPESARLESPTPQTLALNLEAAVVDVLEFDRALASDLSDLSVLLSAINLHRGPLLDGCGEEWILQEREAREHQYVEGLERAARMAAKSGDPSSGARFLRKAIAADPYRESAHCELMRRLAESGDHAAVTAVYRDLRIRLRNELNTEPSRETTALYQSLRQGARDLAIAHVRPGADSETAEQDGSEPHSAALTNLPCQTTSFIGRRREIDEIKRLLGEARLVTLSGAGGTGKTRLSVQAGSELTNDFPDGVWIVELAPLGDSSLVAREAASALRIRDEPGRDIVELLRAHLNDRTTLIILDNCEHLLEAAAGLADTLLKHCAGLRILATSREPLGVPGECTYRVPTLSVPPPRYLPPADQACEYEAIRLFVDRARSGQPDFSSGPHNLPAIIRICQTLDGIPLAIELAAARVRSLPVEQIAARLDDCFRIVGGGSRTALPRHQTLRALIDWSYDLLSGPEKVLFRRLAVFAGGWTLEAAESVCAGGEIAQEDVLDLLGHLSDRSLVLYDSDCEFGRYRLLEPIRQYAAGLLIESGEAAALRQLHLEWFKSAARNIAVSVWSEGGDRFRRELDRELDNLRAALEYARNLNDRGEASVLLASSLMQFWYAQGYWGEGRDWLDDALRRSEGTKSHARARALYAAGVMAWDLDDYERANQVLGEGLALLDEIGDDPDHSLAHTLLISGSCYSAQGDYARAEELLRRALQRHEDDEDKWSSVWTRVYLAELALNRGNLDDAESLAAGALETARDVGHQWGVARSINLAGMIDAVRARVPEALAKCAESRRLMESSGDRRGIALTLLSEALADTAAGNLEESARAAAESLRHFSDLNDRQGIALAVESLGRAIVQQNPESAVKLIYAADQIRRPAGIATPPVFHPLNESALSECRATLTESDYESAQEWPTTHTQEEVVEFALATPVSL